MKYEFKMREGFSLEGIKIPKRFFETESSQGFLKEGEIKKILRMYKSKIGEILLAASPKEMVFK